MTYALHFAVVLLCILTCVFLSRELITNDLADSDASLGAGIRGGVLQPLP